jgi:hypothetical protein
LQKKPQVAFSTVSTASKESNQENIELHTVLECQEEEDHDDVDENTTPLPFHSEMAIRADEDVNLDSMLLRRVIPTGSPGDPAVVFESLVMQEPSGVATDEPGGKGKGKEVIDWEPI